MSSDLTALVLHWLDYKFPLLPILGQFAIRVPLEQDLSMWFYTFPSVLGSEPILDLWSAAEPSLGLDCCCTCVVCVMVRGIQNGGQGVTVGVGPFGSRN